MAGGVFQSIGVIGAGAWGTALAQTARLAGRDVLLWGREADVVDEINSRHVNTAFLPGVALDPDLKATTDLARLAASDVILMVAPAQHVRAVGSELARDLPADKPVVICAKGLEQATGQADGHGAWRGAAAGPAGGAFWPELCRRRGARTSGGADTGLRQ